MTCNIYNINSAKKAVKNCTYSISEGRTNGLLPAGKYTFDATGKMVIETVEPEEPEVTPAPEVKNGLYTDADGEIRYYEEGVAVYAGLVQDADGNYYYINSTKKAVKNCTYIERNVLSEFNSSNTELLNVEQVKKKLLSLKYIRDELAEWENC